MLTHTAYIIITSIYLIVILQLLSVVVTWLQNSHSPTASYEKDARRESPTQIPDCPACEAAEQIAADVPNKPPPPLTSKRGRPRSVETDVYYCPNSDCRYYGWLGLGNIRSNGHPGGSRWRQLECVICGSYFMETVNTIFYCKKSPPDLIWKVLKALAEGLGIRATARVFDLHPNTVDSWLRQAAGHMRAVTYYLMQNLEVSQVQLDELWALLGRQDVDDKGQKQRAKRWVWTAIDPESKLWLAYVIGDRSQALAQRLVHAVVEILTSDCIPLFISDQWSAYQTALLTHFGHWVQIPRRGNYGRHPKPRWLPLPQLQYAQVVKKRHKGRVISVTHRLVYGSLEIVERIMAQSIGNVINTAFMERLNLSIRQHVSALGRKVLAIAKGEVGLDDFLALYRAYYNFCLPHSSLRQPLPQPLPTKGTGSLKKWQQRTPAMAAGLTDRPWRMEELLLFSVPPWPQSRPTSL